MVEILITIHLIGQQNVQILNCISVSFIQSYVFYGHPPMPLKTPNHIDLKIIYVEGRPIVDRASR